MDDVVKLTIDGEEVEVTKGTSVLQAAEEAGFFIPTLCSDADLRPYGACRLCVVEIDGTRGYPAACTTPVTEGMKVRTDSPELQRMRKAAIQLIRSDHPTDCDACPRNQQCDLQMTEALLDAAKTRFQTLVKELPVDKSNPFFNLDRNYCVLCCKCVRCCDEIRGVGAVNLANRGYKAKVSAGMDGLFIDSTCESCGECLDHCPVYALNPKETRKPSKEIETVCPYCGVGCRINLGVRQGEVVTSHGKKEGSVNRGSLCVKGRFGIPEFVHSRDRLGSPLIRKNGELTKASWDEALDFVASKLGSYRSGEVAVIASAKSTNEDTYVAQKFARAALGTNNIDNHARLYLSPSMAALTRILGYGAMTNSLDEISNAGCLLVIDTDITVTHPIAGLKVKQASRNGAKLIVISPRQVDLERFATLTLRIKPETEVALLMGMMKVIVDEGLQDSAFINARCKDFDQLRKSLEAFPIEKVEQITGIPSQRIAEAARDFATRRPSAIVYGTDLARSSRGSDSISAVANLAMLTANIGTPSSGIYPLSAQNNAQGACDMGAMPDYYPGYQSVNDPSIRAKYEAAWGCSLSVDQGLPFSGMLEAASKKQLKAAYVIGANPAAGEQANYVKESLKALEFLVVQDIYLTETAEIAQVVLPAATFAEKDGTFTNTERRVQRIRKSIDPIGDSRADWWITCQIAKKMGKNGFTFDSSSKIMDEIDGLTPIYGGISYARLENDSLQWPCPDKQSEGTSVLHTDGFGKGTGRFMPLEYKSSSEMIDTEYPLKLTLGRSLYYTQTGTMAKKVSGLNTLRDGDTVELNPEDAAGLKIVDGEPVKIVSNNGDVTARAVVTDASAKGTVFMVFPFVNSQTRILDNAAIDPEFKLIKYVPCAVKIEKQSS